jgi:phosphoribosylglycinamide formyltransferase-1
MGWQCYLAEREVELIVLAGYLRKVPPSVIEAYTDRILNSHPALLPAFGGPGMYGRHVHEAVVRSGATESGFTIHLVTEAYDQGPILYQARVPVAGLSAEAVEKLIQAVEREVYPVFVAHYWKKIM